MPVTIEKVEADIASLEQDIQAAQSAREQLDEQIQRLRQQQQTPEVQAQIEEFTKLRSRCSKQMSDAQSHINKCKQKIRNLRGH
jgi:chromosome segregation ATPase